MAAIVGGGRGLGFEETELRLGLARGGDSGDSMTTKNSTKRIFSETIDLKLKLETVDSSSSTGATEGGVKRPSSQKSVVPAANDPAEKPSAPKAQVVGWPPVRSSFRRNIVSAQAEKGSKKEGGEKSGSVAAAAAAATAAAFVKVSMDGAPYLRKVDLKMYWSYQELSKALEKMFSSFTVGNCGSQGMIGRDFMNENKLMDLLNGSEYVPTYEGKDGDWMLVGDVPWDLHVQAQVEARSMELAWMCRGTEYLGVRSVQPLGRLDLYGT